MGRGGLYYLNTLYKGYKYLNINELFISNLQNSPYLMFF